MFESIGLAPRNALVMTAPLTGKARSQLKDVLRPYVVTARRLLRRELRLSDIGYATRVSYSQFGEDLWLADFFADKPTGFYVDVGAFDPFLFSNTLLLYRQGWHGINIEPSPAALARLQRFRPRDTNLGLAISDVDGQTHLLLDGSFSSIERPKYKALGPSSRIVVRTRRLEEVLSEWTHGVEIDLLDVDCEGMDLTVLQSNDWHRFRPRVVLAESHDDPPADLESFMERAGYERVARFKLTYAFERID
jgi:FkbM family methyltransferase